MRTLNGKTEPRILRNGKWVKMPINSVSTWHIIVAKSSVSNKFTIRTRE